MTLEVEKKCGGCGKSGKDFNECDRYFKYYDVTVRLCRSRSQYEVREECYNKFIASQQMTGCRACGNQNSRVPVCEACVELLKALRSDESDKRDVYINPYLIDRPYGIPFGPDSEIDHQLASIIGGSVRVCMNYLPKENEVIGWPLSPALRGGYGGHHYYRVTGTEKQIEAARRMVQLIQLSFKQAVEDAHEKGRALLLGLANGDLTTSQFDDRLAKPNKAEEE